MRKAIKLVSMALIAVTVIFTATAFAGIPQPSSGFYVADYSDVISQETEDYIASKNAELEDLCGGQIVVVTVDFLDGMDIEDYCYKIFEEWKIGSAKENNGVLLLLAIGEDNYWCMQGKGLEKSLTSGEIGDMLWDYLEDDFAAGNYDSGVRTFFDKMYDEVSDIYSNGSAAGTRGFDFNIVKIVVIALVVIVILVIVASIGRSGVSRQRSYRRSRPPMPRPPRRPRRSSGYDYRPPRPSRPSRPTRSHASSRSSFSGRSSGGMGRGGGGSSRGGGAGRRTK